MEKDKFSFGAASVMREVPPGQTAVIKFNGKAEKVETDWGDKFSYQILIYSHPSYESIPCNHCQDVIANLSLPVESILKHR
jgi:cytidine deaminase